MTIPKAGFSGTAHMTTQTRRTLDKGSYKELNGIPPQKITVLKGSGRYTKSFSYIKGENLRENKSEEQLNEDERKLILAETG